MPSDGFKFIWGRDSFVHSFTGQTLKYKLNVRGSVRVGASQGTAAPAPPRWSGRLRAEQAFKLDFEQRSSFWRRTWEDTQWASQSLSPPALDVRPGKMVGLVRRAESQAVRFPLLGVMEGCEQGSENTTLAAAHAEWCAGEEDPEGREKERKYSRNNAGTMQ